MRAKLSGAFELCQGPGILGLCQQVNACSSSAGDGFWNHDAPAALPSQHGVDTGVEIVVTSKEAVTSEESGSKGNIVPEELNGSSSDDSVGVLEPEVVLDS